ncbi:MAG: hypothetical protein K6V97_14860 [Actinomycetia bacterium]|nr:hypothetical protein [Actinomycetes bacterium]
MRVGIARGPVALLAAGLLTAGAAAAAWAQTVPDLSQDGFPTVAAQQTVSPNQAATVTAGDITIRIPAGTFSTPVQFELLEGSNATWQAKAPAGQKVIANFAFKVVNSETGELVGTFAKPVVFTLTNPAVGPASKYWNITPAGAMVTNPVAPTISGDTLSHPITAALVGWAVTSPAAATSVSTGLPLAPVMGGGLALAAAGLYLLRRPRHA